MQKTTSQKALKVISIIMIVFAALTLLLGIGGIVTGGASASWARAAATPEAPPSSEAWLPSPASSSSSEAPSTWPSASSACAAPTTRARSARGANDPRKIGAFYVLAIIGLAFAVLSALGTFFGGSADGGDIASALFGLVLPLACVLLAYNIKKENHL